MSQTSKTIDTILAEAVEIASFTERAAFVEKACEGNGDLQRRVETLMANHFEAGDFLAAPAHFDGMTQITSVPDPNIGSMIGPYKLREVLGQGGMGIVYVGEQEKPFRRKVALKLIKPGMDSREVIARFEAERQALALMDHPHIAKVLDAGTNTDTGRPYFVMEFVRGIPITEYCDKCNLSTEDRLRLFTKVCHAVQHAHLKGIIHRDIKPSNVLVTLHDGVPVLKVIDFGVAKAINQRLSEHSIYTGHLQIVGTPLYMSPEQAELSGLDIDTRSDVYSLGVLLYELLTGATPFDRASFSRAGFDEMRRIIREDEPPRPSQRVSTLEVKARSTVSGKRGIDERELVQILSGELDWIVMKSLEKDRTRRYETASAFAADVQCHLDDETVLACPPTFIYRLRKLTGRNKVALGFVSVIVLGLVIGVVGLGVANSTLMAARHQTQNALDEASENFKLARKREAEALASQKAAEGALQQTEAERKVAEKNFQQSFSIVENIVTKITEWNLSEQPGMEQYRVQLLESASGALAKLLETRPTDEKAIFLRVGVLSALAMDYTSMERLADAQKAYQTAIQTAEELTEKTVADVPAYRSLQWDLRYGYGFLLSRTGKLEDAIRELQIALPAAESNLKNTQDQKTLRGQVCKLLRTLSEFEEWSGNQADSRQHLLRVCELLGIQVDANLQLSTPFSETDITKLLSSGIHPDDVPSLLMSLSEKQNMPEMQLSLLRQAVSTSRDNAQLNPLRSVRHQLAFDLDYFASYLRRTSRFDEALATEREAVTIMERLTTEFPTFAVYRSDLLRMRISIAYSLESLQRFEEALTLLDQLAQQYPDDTTVLFFRGNLNWTHRKDPNRAKADYEKAIAIEPDNWGFRTNFARLLLWNTTPDQTFPDPKQGLIHAQYAAKLKPDDPTSWSLVAQAYDKSGDLVESEKFYEKTLTIDPMNPLGLGGIASLQIRKGEFELARATVAKLMAVAPEVRSSWCTLGDLHTELQEYGKALEAYSKAIEFDPSFSYTYKSRALTQFHLEHDSEALADIAKAIELNPDDTSTLIWISPALILKRPDTTFYNGLLKIADQAVERANQSPASYIGRAQLLVEFGEFEKARQDFRSVVSAELPGYYQHYQVALLSIKLNDLEGYKASCQLILNATTTTSKAIELQLASWTCALAPGAVKDYTEVLAFSRAAISANPVNPQFINGLGAVLMRAGGYSEAKLELERALTAVDSENTSRSDGLYFLAMTEHHLGNVDAARVQLTTANELADRELAGDPSWKRRLTIELLRKEAQNLISDTKN